MKIFAYNEHRNFGDMLNYWLWPKLLPNLLDDDDNELLFGIGSILGFSCPPNARKHVLGSGFGGYTDPPQLDETWNVEFVRGPRTAKALGLDPSRALTDPAILVSEALKPASGGHGIAFMPHWESMRRGNWEQACACAGITLIDPRGPIDSILLSMRQSEMLITEAMHGAIVADAIRLPWIAVNPIHTAHRAKWLDWADSMALELRPLELAPSSVLEASTRLIGNQGLGRRSTQFKEHRVVKGLDKVLIEHAARRLRTLAECRPMLSDPVVFKSKGEQVAEAVFRFAKATA